MDGSVLPEGLRVLPARREGAMGGDPDAPCGVEEEPIPAWLCLLRETANVIVHCSHGAASRLVESGEQGEQHWEQLASLSLREVVRALYKCPRVCACVGLQTA